MEEQFINFLKKELFPEVERRYKVAPFRTLIGLSPTSAFILHIFWKGSELFQAYIAIASADILNLEYSKGITV